MTIGVLDLETQNHSSFGWKHCNPHDDRNFIVSYSIQINNDHYTHYYTDRNFEEVLKAHIYECGTIICHNVKFDILFLYVRYQWFRDWVKQGGKIWCTMIVEYILSGQREPYCSLNSLAEKYGGTQKLLDLSKDHYDQGRMTTDIPRSTLLEYNAMDVTNTVIVFKAQLPQLRANEQMPLMKRQMESILFLIECEYNGMYIDRAIAKARGEGCDTEIATLETIILDELPEEVPREVWNLSSNDHRSAIFYGGKIKWKERGPLLDEEGNEVLIKSPKSPNFGKPKITVYPKEVHVKGLGCEPEENLKKEGYFSTKEHIIAKLADSGVELAKTFQEVNKLITLRDKYFNKLPNYVYEKDGCVHTSFGVDLITGRLSSKRPNVQQQPRQGNVKSMYTSRFGKNGHIIQADQGQLEVRVLAYLAQCPRLMHVIRTGQDMHALSVMAWKKRKDFTDEERTDAKRMTFQLTYGAGPFKMFNTLAIPVDEAKAFIRGFYKTYFGVHQWHKQLESEVNSRREGKYSNLINPSKRKLVFEETYYERSGQWTFKPTEFKNYPVQSTAADIIIVQMGVLLRRLLPYQDKCKIINTVHDSIMLDCHSDLVDTIIPIVQETMEDTEELGKLFDSEFNVPLKVDISLGPSWDQQTKIEVKL